MAQIPPWARGPFELIKHGENHLRAGSDFDKRMALISFDNAIEVSITTYLQLNPKLRGGRKYPEEDRRRWQANYHSKLEFFEQYVSELDYAMQSTVDEMIWHHSLRNELYHSGNGMVPEESALEGARDGALAVFSALFNVDAGAMLDAAASSPDPVPQHEQERRSAEINFMRSFIEFERALQSALSAVDVPASRRPHGVLQLWDLFVAQVADLRQRDYSLSVSSDSRRHGEVAADEPADYMPLPATYPMRSSPRSFSRFLSRAQETRNALAHSGYADLSEDEMAELANRLAAAKQSVPHHNVYVVELNKSVLGDRKLLAANPNRDPSKPCVYVGLTGLAPEERLENHRKGRKANKYVREYGERLLPELYEQFNPMFYEEAVRKEAELARDLRDRGYTVWSN